MKSTAPARPYKDLEIAYYTSQSTPQMYLLNNKEGGQIYGDPEKEKAL